MDEAGLLRHGNKQSNRHAVEGKSGQMEKQRKQKDRIRSADFQVKDVKDAWNEERRVLKMVQAQPKAVRFYNKIVARDQAQELCQGQLLISISLRDFESKANITYVSIVSLVPTIKLWFLPKVLQLFGCL